MDLTAAVGKLYLAELTSLIGCASSSVTSLSRRQKLLSGHSGILETVAILACDWLFLRPSSRAEIFVEHRDDGEGGLEAMTML